MNQTAENPDAPGYLLDRIMYIICLCKRILEWQAFLGVWLILGGFAYVIMSFTGELLPQYQEKVFIIS